MYHEELEIMSEYYKERKRKDDYLIKTPGAGLIHNKRGIKTKQSLTFSSADEKDTKSNYEVIAPSKPVTHSTSFSPDDDVIRDNQSDNTNMTANQQTEANEEKAANLNDKNNITSEVLINHEHSISRSVLNLQSNTDSTVEV